MKTEYKSDLKKNYLVVEPEREVNSEDYDVRMMEQNQIQGFLPMQVRKLDGSCYLYYEITSMQQVDLVYGKKQLQSDDIRHIFSGVKDILESARKYLLRPGQILFDPQYMYMEMQTGKICVCYLPIKESGFSVLPLAEFILKKLNHEDSDAVSLGYDFYQKATQPNISLSDTLHEMLAGTYRGKQENSNFSDNYEKEEFKKEGYGKEGYEREKYRETGHGNPESTARYREEDAGTSVYENVSQMDSYEVYHKERRKEKSGKKKNRKKNRIFQEIHPAILILTILLTAVLGILLYFQWLGFTETGGLFFILLSIAILVNRFWKNRREKNKEKNGENRKKKRAAGWEQDQYEEDPYMEEMQRLRAELYGCTEENMTQAGGDSRGEKRELQRGNRYEKGSMMQAEDSRREEEKPQSGNRYAKEDIMQEENRSGEEGKRQGKNRYMEKERLQTENRYEEEMAQTGRKYGETWEKNRDTQNNGSGYGYGERTQYLGGLEKSAGLCLISEWPEKYPQIFIRDRILIVGKKKSQADIILDEAAVSRIHARLEYHQGGYYIMDLDSKNGTYLNGVRLVPQKQFELRDGDRVAFANISYRTVIEDESEMTQLLR